MTKNNPQNTSYSREEKKFHWIQLPDGTKKQINKKGKSIRIYPDGKVRVFK